MATDDITEEKIYARRRENEYPVLADLNLVHETVLLPTPKIQDKDVLHKLKEKAKLGFGSVHTELKKIMKRKQKDTPRTYSLDMTYNTNKTKKKEKLKSSISMDETKSTIQREPSFPIHKRQNVPLPPLPREATTSAYATEDDPSSQYDYVAVERLPESEPTKVTARIQPISASERNPPDIDVSAEVCMPNPKSRRPDVLGRPTKSSSCPVPSTPEGPNSENEVSVFDYEPLEVQYDDTGNPTDINQQPSGLPFFSYSVDEVVQCLTYCGLSELALVCKEQRLDGNFFKSTDGDTIKSLFNLSGLGLLKLEKIYTGWRPKLA